MSDMFSIGIGGPQGSPIQPQAPVVDSSNAQTLNSLASAIPSILGNAANSYATSSADRKKQESLDVRSGVLSGYSQKVTSINAAVEQGSMSWSEAKTRTRALYNQTVANYPGLTEDLTKFQKELNSTAGLGDVIAKGTAADQQYEDNQKKAIAAGFPNTEDGVERFMELEHSIYNMNYQSKQLALQAAKLEVVNKQESIANSRANRANAELERKVKLNKINLQNNLSDVNVAYFSKINGDVQGVLDNENMTGEQKMQALTEIRNNYTAVLNPIRAGADPSFVDSLTKPTFDMINTALDFANGKVGKEVAQNNVDKNLAYASSEIMRDPKLAFAAAASKLFPQFDTAIINNVGPRVVELLNRNTKADIPPANLVDPDDQEQVKTYLKGVGGIATKIEQKDPTITDPKGAMTELSANVNNILKGVNAFSLSVEKPSQLNNVTNFLASKDFINYQKIGGQIDAANTGAVRGIIQEQYNNQVVVAVKREWENSKTTVGAPTGVKQIGRITVPIEDKKPTTEALQYKWSGDALVFMPAKGMEQNRFANAKAREMNSKVAPLINKMVRMNAHLEGSEDYAKYFEAEESAIFGTVEGEGDATQ